MAGQFNIPGWNPTTMTYTQPTKSVASITKGASPEVLQMVKDMLSKTPSAMVQQSTISPDKAQILDEIFSKPKNELPSVFKETSEAKPKSFYKQLSNVDKKLSELYKKGVPKISKRGIVTGIKTGNVLGKAAMPFAIASTLGTLIGDNPIDEKVASGLSLLGTAGMARGRSPYISIPSAILATGAGTYPIWGNMVKGKLNELETNKQLAMDNKTKQEQPVAQQAEVSEEDITEPIPNVGQWDGTRVDSTTNFVNGLTNGSNIQPNITNQNVSAPEIAQQQFVYETPKAKQDYIDRIEQFANNYPALLEQDRRRQMQAALLAPVINNDKFVNAAVGQGTVETTAKQLELLNTAADARISEAQRPLLAQAFAKAGIPPELAYASEGQLKSLINLLVATTQAETGRYKADVDAQTDRYVADVKTKAILHELAKKYGPEAAIIAGLRSGDYTLEELKREFSNGWNSLVGISNSGAPVKTKREANENYDGSNIIFSDEKKE